MLKALVVGGFAAKTRGAWARALREQCGIEVVYHYGADNEFKGIPDELPKGVDLVLVVIGTCSHRASDKGKSLAWRGGARFEPVSKDTSRAVEWLKGKGYRAGQPVPEREPVVPVVPVEPAKPVLAVVPEPVVEPEVEQAPEPAVEWLDVAQVRELVPLKPTTFYDLVKDVVKRPVRYERRTVWRSVGNRNYSVSQRVMVWTMDEIATIESEARKRGMLEPPPPPKSIEPVAFPTTFTKTPVVHAAPEPVVLVSGPELTLKPVLGELRDYHAEVRLIMDEYAHKRTQGLQAQLAEVTAERDALREQLAKIKSALGLG